MLICLSACLHSGAAVCFWPQPAAQCSPTQVATPLQGRSEWEIFYAYPSISAPAFFEALAGASEEAARAPPSAAEAYDALLELSRSAQVPRMSECDTFLGHLCASAQCF